MQRADHPAPFDHEFQASVDMTEEFWGPSARWQSSDDRSSRRLPRVDDTGSLRALRDGVAAFRPQRVELRDSTGEVRRTRAHGLHRAAPPSVAAATAEVSIGDLASGRYDNAAAPVTNHGDSNGAGDHAADVTLTPSSPIAERLGLGAVDPLLVRLGAIVLIGILLVPIALALRPASAAPNTVQIEAPEPSPIGAGGAAAVAPTGAAAASTEAASIGGGVDPSGQVVADVGAVPSVASVDDAATGVADGATSGAAANPDDVTSDGDETVGVDAATEQLAPACPQSYDASVGDSWYGIADAAGITPSELVEANGASFDTVILPGSDICLPEGATMPEPAAAKVATAADPESSATTQPTTTRSTTTSAPTTVASTTAVSAPAGSPGRNASVDEVKAVIRSVFPESEWETAFEIVQRESRFRPAAYNGWCCYGLFQIYWTAHDGWLDDFGIDSADDLLDPLLNTRAAHALWQRSGNSWSAWSTYDLESFRLRP
jgi:LysM repeat protein